MQLRFRTPVMAALSALLLLSACSKTNKQGKMISKDAGFVLHFNAKSISEKINMQEVKGSDWYKKAMAELKADSTGPEFMKKLLDNSKSTGIDSTSDLIIFGESKVADGMKIVVEGGIKDIKDFENFIKKVYPEGVISKSGDISVMPVKNKAVLTWNNEKFAACMKTPEQNNFALPLDSANTQPVAPDQTAALTEYCKKLYTLKDDENLASDKRFTELMNTDGEMHVWLNTEKLMNGIPQMGVLSMLKMDKLLVGNISTYTLNFENGKISLKSKGYAGKELGDLFSKYSGGKINTDMIKNIPSKDIAAVFAMHFQPEGLKELIKLSGMDGFIDLMIASKGVSVDDFIKANKGDIMVAVTDLKVKRDSLSYKGFDGTMQSTYSEQPSATYFFSAAIADKDAFTKLINTAKNQMPGTDSSISYNSNGSYFAIGNSADGISKYLAGSAKNEPEFLSKISGNAIGGYVDLQKIMKAYQPTNSTDSIKKQIYDEALKTWDNIYLTGGDYSDGGYNQTLELNMLDKNTNSLKQLFKYLVNMGNLEKSKQKIRDAEYSNPVVDTVRISPAMPKGKE